MKKRKKSFYTEEFKWKVVKDVLSEKMTKEEARRIYNIRGKSAILYWMRRFSGNDFYINGTIPARTNLEISNMKEQSKKDKQIQELKEELKRERHRADLWQEIIRIADKQLNIDIVKKFGAKQSTPSKNKQGTK
jgi:transposase-like protein